MNWDILVVILIVSLATLYLARRVWLRYGKMLKSSAGCCPPPNKDYDSPSGGGGGGGCSSGGCGC